MSKLLINESPLQVLPSLAVLIGLHEAIALQQLHYWLCPARKPKIIDGVPWVYNSANEWHKQFPFLSMSTIWRLFDSLEERGLVKSDNFNRSKFDRTKWYTINYTALEELEGPHSALVENGFNPTEPTIPEIKTETINLPAKPAGDAGLPNGKNPPTRAVVLMELEQAFSASANIPLPLRGTKKECSAASVRWWKPLEHIYGLVEKDLCAAKLLVEQAVQRMRAEKLTVSAPQSIEQVATAIIGERGPSAPADGIDYNKFGYTPSGKLVEMK